MEIYVYIICMGYIEIMEKKMKAPFLGVRLKGFGLRVSGSIYTRTLLIRAPQKGAPNFFETPYGLLLKIWV